MDLFLGPIVGSIRGNAGGPNAKFTYISGPKGSLRLQRPYKQPAWLYNSRPFTFTRLAMKALDSLWHSLTPAQKLLWRKHAPGTSRAGRSLLDYYRHVNLPRLYLGMTPIPTPPIPERSTRIFATRSDRFPNIPAGETKVAWERGVRYGTSPDIGFDIWDEECDVWEDCPELPPPPAMATACEIFATAGDGGTITPAGHVMVDWHSFQSFIITPSPGYEIEDVIVDFQSVGPIGFFTFAKVINDHSIHAKFYSAQPQPCGWDCSDCPPTLLANVSGLYWGADFCNYANGLYVLENMWGMCYWFGYNDFAPWPWTGNTYVSLYCWEDMWYAQVIYWPNGWLSAEFSKPNITGCPPLGNWPTTGNGMCVTGNETFTLATL